MLMKIKELAKKSLIILIIIGICFTCFNSIKNVRAASINTTNVTIYGLGTRYENLSIPESLRKDYQLNVTGTSSEISYEVIEGNSVNVSSTGLITPKYEYWKCEEYLYCISVPEDSEDYSYSETIEGESTIEVTAGKEKFIVKVNVIDYARYNAEKVMQDYVDKNITSNMTEMQKMQKILELIATTKYSYDSGTYTGLISGDGANCIGDSEAIVYMSNLVGIKAHMRFANRDIGAGNDHYNVAALLDGKVYVVDVMSSSNPPRATTIESTNNGFSEGRSTKDGSRIYLQYDGYDENVELKYDGVITELGDWLMYYGGYDGTVVKTVTIPKEITKIGIGAFNRLPSLTDVFIDEENPNYMSKSGILYSKDGSTLYSYPAGKKEKTFTIPSSVKTLSKYSMSYNENLQEVIIPNTVEKIESSAFRGVKNLQSVILPESVSEIGDNAFNTDEYGHDYIKTLKYIVVKNPEATLGEKLCSKTQPIYGLANSTAEIYAKENGCPFGVIASGQDTFKLITDLNISVPNIEYSGDVNIPKVIIKDGDYTLKENVDFKVLGYLDNDKITDYARVKIMGIGKYVGYAEIVFSITYIDFNKATVEGVNDYYELIKYGEDVEPSPIVKLNGKQLIEDVDYRIYYVDSYKIGTAYMEIVGLYNYVGRITKTYNIVGLSSVNMSLPENVVLDVNESKQLNLLVEPDIKIVPTWESSNSNVVSVDNNGKITAKKRGIATITATYKTKKATTKVIVGQFLKGDLNYSNDIELEDVMEALKIVTEQKKATESDIEVGDFDGNGEVDTQDAFQILYIYVNSK